MALLRVLKYPHPFLTTVAKRVDINELTGGTGALKEEVGRLIDDMVGTMYANRGIGLAAVQVGVDKRIIVLDIPVEEPEEFDESGEDGDYIEPGEEENREWLNDEPLNLEFSPGRTQGKNLIALINPVITWTEGRTKFEEGCLSVPGITSDVQRFERIQLNAFDREGKSIEIEAGGLFAIALQHEVDHLDGILFIDRLSRLKRDYIKRKLKKAFEAEQRAL